MKLFRGILISSKNSRNGWRTLTLFDRFVAITCQKGWGRFELVWSNPPALGLLLLDLDVSSTHISEHSVAVELCGNWVRLRMPFLACAEAPVSLA
ncbi:hypothetical protein B0T13DRAFT_197795 [Neurospora crassa]|nr:hypothetical protein B0T13DRAFT_197795 [Neurospora crassa]